MTVILQDRLEAVKDIPLSIGPHPAPDKDEIPCAFCAEEKWCWITGLPWSDRPENKSEVIAAFVCTFQDNIDQAGRDVIDVWQIENADRLAATANDEHDEARGFLAVDWATRVALPLWLDVAGATDAAAWLRARPVVGSRADAKAMREPIRRILADLQRSKILGKAAEAAASAAEAVAATEAACAGLWAAWAAEVGAWASYVPWAPGESCLSKAKVLELWSDATTEIKTSAMELLDRMVAL